MKGEEKVNKDIDELESKSNKTLIRFLYNSAIILFSLSFGIQSKMISDKNDRIELLEFKNEKLGREKDSISEVRLKEKDRLLQEKEQLVKDGIKREQDFQEYYKDKKK